MYVQLIQRGLLNYIRSQVARGDLTERGLARRVGISQPYMHHILKGSRAISPELTDALMEELRINISDFGFVPPVRAGSVPLLRGRAGPNYNLIEMEGVPSFYSVAPHALTGIHDPVAFFLGEDPGIFPEFQAEDLAIADRSAQVRLNPDTSAPYLIRTARGSLVRYLRFGGRSLYLLGSRCDAGNPAGWEYLSMGALDPMQIILGKIVSISRNLLTCL